MKTVESIHGTYHAGDWDFPDYGKLVFSVDNSEDYDVDEGRVYFNGRRYTVLFAEGCSCWDGDWGGWTDLTKTELTALAKRWTSKDRDHSMSTEHDIGTWWLKEGRKAVKRHET